MPGEESQQVYEGRVVRLTEVLTSRGVPSMIESRSFVDCDIHGPAVIVLLGDVRIEDSGFDAPPDVIFIRGEENRRYLGVIGVRDTAFQGCRFHNVAILGPTEQLQIMREGTASD